MPSVTVSPKFQVVIPKAVRRAMDLRAGEKVQVFRYADRIELVRVRNVGEIRGIARGISTRVRRERDRV